MAANVKTGEIAMKKTKTFQDTLQFAQMVASKHGWVLHPDREFLDILIDGLTINYNRYGYYSCPCRDADGVRDQDKDIICPCDYCPPDIKEYGHCYCGLYNDPEFIKNGGMPKSIPERRQYNFKK